MQILYNTVCLQIVSNCKLQYVDDVTVSSESASKLRVRWRQGSRKRGAS